MIVPFPKIWLYVAAVVIVVVMVAGAYIYATVTINRLIADATARASIERDAFWRGQIAESNAAVERERAEQAIRAAAAEAQAQAELATLRDQLTTIEAQNAALPDPGRCGVDAGRLRLLPQ